MRKIFFIIMVLIGVNLFAQGIDNYIELMRSDIKTEKIAMINSVMQFTDKQSEAFWPIYREFSFEQEKLADKRVNNIKEFALNYDSLNAETADKLIKATFSFQKERLDLNEDLYNKLSEALDPIVASKYMQLENQIQLIIDLNISANLPLAKKPEKVK